MHVYLFLRTPLGILVYSLGCILTTLDLHVKIRSTRVSGTSDANQSAQREHSMSQDRNLAEAWECIS